MPTQGKVLGTHGWNMPEICPKELCPKMANPCHEGFGGKTVQRKERSHLSRTCLPCTKHHTQYLTHKVLRRYCLHFTGAKMKS